ncbi:hypothetical protein VW35_03610 [Devosia soli]|uniref:Uncharacterized protein n=1 Tax=Devosia soli TaxID=361041 RepID=A0A0F5LFV9_9HYPH|nr:hypothetical protein [Devosia soli]KKB81228.1 hypothetical protein VW35_03610 [Devosia soli]
MDIMWIAIAVNLTVYGLIGWLIVRIFRRRLPDPWNQPSFTIPVAIALGAFITMLTYTHWLIYPN